MAHLTLSEAQMVAQAAEFIQQTDARLRELGLVTLTEAAKTAGIPIATLSDAVRKQAIPSVKYGNQRLIRVAAVRQYFDLDEASLDETAQKRLLECGLLMEIRSPNAHAFRPLKRAVVMGQPVSQTIVEDRR